METNRTEHLTTSVMTDATEPAATVAPKKDFVEPELSDPSTFWKRPGFSCRSPAEATHVYRPESPPAGRSFVRWWLGRGSPRSLVCASKSNLL